MLENLMAVGSPWNTKVTQKINPTLYKHNFPVGIDVWQNPDVWSIPSYQASASDPLVPVLYNANAWMNVWNGVWKRAGNTAAVEAAILKSSSNKFPFSGNVYSSTSTTSWVLPANYNKVVNPADGSAKTVHSSKAPLPALGPDGHMIMIQPDNTVLETYATIVLSTGQIVCLSYSISNAKSICDGYQNGQTASMLPIYAGLIDEETMLAGINHTMAITVPAQALTPKIVAPAYAFDRGAMTENPPYSGTLPMGARLVLSSKFAGKLYSAEGKAIAAAAKDYGFIVIDRGGGGITIRAKHNPNKVNSNFHNYTNSLAADLKSIFQNLYVA